MKTVRFILFLTMLAAMCRLWAQHLTDCDVIDIRNGLPENRVRCIEQLADGRIAIATAATITVYDGTRFHTATLAPDREFLLTDYLGKRHMTCDSLGLIWLRNTRCLYVVDSRTMGLVTNIDSLLEARHLTQQQVSAWPADTITWKSDTMVKSLKAQGVKVSALLHDKYGGHWFGTTYKGLLYFNPQRKRQFKTSSGNFPFKKQHVYQSLPRSSEMAAKYASHATNCTLETNGYLYIGTRGGVMVIDPTDSLEAVIDEDYGLLTNNVAALISDKRGDIWAATAGGGLSRLHRTGQATFDIVNYGPLDGVQTEGQEFRTGFIHCDDTSGIVTVGFVGGYCTFHPDSVNTPRYTFHYPKKKSLQKKKMDCRHIGGGFWLLPCLFLP